MTVVAKVKMRFKIWIRWLVLHGVAGVMLRVLARRGDPFAALLVGPDRGIDPYPAMESIRASGRVVRTSMLHLTVDHEVCQTIMRDRRFGATQPSHLGGTAPVRRLIERSGRGLPNPTDPPAMLVMDPPEHTRLRKPVTATFTPRAMTGFAATITEITADLLDELEGRTHAEMIEQFAARLPVAVIGHVLGVPPRDQHLLLQWGNSGAPLFDIGVAHHRFRAGIEGLAEGQRYFDRHIDRLRIEPDSSVLGQVVESSDLNQEELRGIAQIVMGAGFETAMNMLGSGIVLLLRNPEQLAALRADPALWPSAVEEILRMESPAQMTMRTALEDITVAGETIPAGAVVMLLLGGANRDPQRFPDPERFDVTRTGGKEHLAFGQGIHTCLGARLARLEGAIGLRMLFERFPELSLDGQPELRGLAVLRGYARVPVRLGTTIPAAAQSLSSDESRSCPFAGPVGEASVPTSATVVGDR